MKHFIVFLLLCGCATFQVTSPTGWSAKYTRFWDQELSDVYLDIDKNGTVHAGIGSQKTEAQKTLERMLQVLKEVK